MRLENNTWDVRKYKFRVLTRTSEQSEQVRYTVYISKKNTFHISEKNTYFQAFMLRDIGKNHPLKAMSHEAICPCNLQCNFYRFCQ